MHYLLVAKGNRDHKGELKGTDPSQPMGGFSYTVTCNLALHESNTITVLCSGYKKATGHQTSSLLPARHCSDYYIKYCFSC